MNPRICISGIGVISPLGIGCESYWASLAAGRDGVSQVNRFDRSPLRCRLGAQVLDFDAAALIGAKGLRYIDRLSQFAIAAARLALEDAGVSLEEIEANRRGIVLGTAFGGLTSQQDFNRERVLEGPQWVSPMKFPNTPINALSYQIPIRFQMKLVNVTISSGMTSSLEAMRYAGLMLRRRPDALLLCGGVEELSFLAYYGTYFMNELAGISGDEISCPFDQRRNGYILGEGGALMVLETLQGLEQRRGKGLAEIRGYGSAFAPRQGNLAVKINAVATAMQTAIQNAAIQPHQIDYIAASANSGPQTDLIEAKAVAQVFGEKASSIPISAIKSMLGEAFGASGALQVAAAILALQRGILPPTINIETLDPECSCINCLTEMGRRREVRYALVNSIDRYGSVVSLVLGRIE